MKPINLKRFLETCEIYLLKKALKSSNNNAARAAILLGLKTTTMVEKMKKYELKRNLRMRPKKEV